MNGNQESSNAWNGQVAVKVCADLARAAPVLARAAVQAIGRAIAHQLSPECQARVQKGWDQMVNVCRRLRGPLILVACAGLGIWLGPRLAVLVILGTLLVLVP
jgi:hypothetical protein